MIIMRFNSILGIIGSAGVMAVSASDVELWVGVGCSAIIAVVTCVLQVIKMIRDAKNNDNKNSVDNNTEVDDDGKD